MNNYIPSGTSLFDILSMIIPGGLIIVLIADLTEVTVSNTACCYSFIFYTLFFVLSYLVGLIWNSLMDWLTVGFRNNEVGIKYAKLSIGNHTDTNSEKCDCIKWYKFRILCNVFCRKKSKGTIIDGYIDAYYKVAKESIGNVIIILETQVAFIRNMVLVILGYGIYILFSNQFIAGLFECQSKFVLGISLIIISVLLLFIMISRQQKIYYLIWEGELYISDK